MRNVQRSWVPFDEPFPSPMDKFKQRKFKENDGFVTATDMPFILKEDPMCKLLVKHGMGRFICTAQDLAFMIECIEDHPKGYIRSVEFYNPPPRRL